MKSTSTPRHVVLNVCAVPANVAAPKDSLHHKEQLVCISALAVDAGKTIERTFTGDEKDLVGEFWNFIRPYDRFVGYNTVEFTVGSLRMKALESGFRPKNDFELQRLYSHEFQDVLHLWSTSCLRPRPGLDGLFDIFGLQRKRVIESKVLRFWKSGDFDGLVNFSRQETRFTYAAFKRMTNT